MRFREIPKGWLSLVILLSGLIFMLQRFNLFTFSNATCDLYYFDPHCTNWGHFVSNKFLRLLLNLVTIYLVQTKLLDLVSFSRLYLPLFVFVAALIDLYLQYVQTSIPFRIHGFLHPLAFSPVVTLVLLAGMFITPFPKNSKSEKL